MQLKMTIFLSVQWHDDAEEWLANGGVAESASADVLPAAPRVVSSAGMFVLSGRGNQARFFPTHPSFLKEKFFFSLLLFYLVACLLA
jgi:hypothetical protein